MLQLYIIEDMFYYQKLVKSNNLTFNRYLFGNKEYFKKWNNRGLSSAACEQ